MPKFILVYHGGKQQPNTPEEGAKRMEQFKAWMNSIGSTLVSPANPVGPSKIITADGVKDAPVPDAFNGYSVIDVETFEEALDIGKRCPFLEIGTIEVAQLKEMTLNK